MILFPADDAPAPRNRCRECGHRLTDPISRVLGIGPDCRKALGPSPRLRIRIPRRPGGDSPDQLNLLEEPVTDCKRVYRYEVPVDDQTHTFRLTSNPRAVAASTHPEIGVIVEFWAEHHGEHAVERTFQVFGTGHPIPASAQWWGTTPRALGLVWHLFELRGSETSRG